jgi:hypothetical protein
MKSQGRTKSALLPDKKSSHLTYINTSPIYITK